MDLLPEDFNAFLNQISGSLLGGLDANSSAKVSRPSYILSLKTSGSRGTSFPYLGTFL